MMTRIMNNSRFIDRNKQNTTEKIDRRKNKMSKTLKIGINRTKLAIALVLLCAAFSFSAMAQDNSNEPLDAEAVSALIGELKEGLPNLIDDEAQVEAIAEKWNAREDLAGKSKAQILKMLFADVKSVAEDKETQDNIWKSWGGRGKKQRRNSGRDTSKAGNSLGSGHASASDSGDPGIY